MPILVSVLVVLSLILPGQVNAQMSSGGGLIDWSQGNCSHTFSNYGTVLTIEAIECALATFLNVAISIIGVIILVMLVYGGFLVLFSSGNPQKVEQGKNVITFAVGGLLMAILSWSVLVLISEFTGAEEIKIFDIPNSQSQPGLPDTNPGSGGTVTPVNGGGGGSGGTVTPVNGGGGGSGGTVTPVNGGGGGSGGTVTPVNIACTEGQRRCSAPLGGTGYYEDCVNPGLSDSTYWQLTNEACSN